jgi:hypothetical protein
MLLVGFVDDLKCSLRNSGEMLRKQANVFVQPDDIFAHGFDLLVRTCST